MALQRDLSVLGIVKHSVKDKYGRFGCVTIVFDIVAINLMLLCYYFPYVFIPLLYHEDCTG